MFGEFLMILMFVLTLVEVDGFVPPQKLKRHEKQSL
jgi:hypothetical protein